MPDEVERGELYPVITAWFTTFSHFGIGVGAYFMQLLWMSAVLFICMGCMVPAILEYTLNDYGIELKPRLVSLSAACDLGRPVPAVRGCDTPTGRCDAIRKFDCELPFNAAMLDMIFCGFFVLAVLASHYFERRIQEDLDLRVQTPQDYSIVVQDPGSLMLH